MPALIRLGARGALILSVIGVVTLAALNRDATGSTLGHFTMGGIDLLIDSTSTYNGAHVPGATWTMKNLTPGADKFFNFPDIKPGDFGCNVISLHVKKGDAWLCLDFKNLHNLDNGVNEPEFPVDPNGNTSGELASNLQFFGWLDNGNGVYNNGEKIFFGTSTKAATSVLNDKSYAISDSKSGGACHKDDTRYIGMCWCAGVLTVNTTTGKMSCDGRALGNLAQTDSMTLDVSVRALAANDNPKFLCNATVTPPPPPAKPKIKYFDADPNSIKKGHSATLSWSVTGATKLSINQGIGTVTGNSKNVSPTTTKSYILTATNAGGTTTASLTVNVHN